MGWEDISQLSPEENVPKQTPLMKYSLESEAPGSQREGTALGAGVGGR